MSKVSVIGLDLAKSVFQVHGVDAQGQVVERKRLRRGQVRKFFAGLPPCLVGMEACASAHYWARELSRLGHTVRLMPPAYVKPYVKTNKNDPNDAEGICEAVQRPNMRFVSVKTPDQQAVLQLHGARDLLVRQQVALSNQMRSVLAEHGIVLPRGHQVVLRRLPELLEDADNGLPMPVRHLLAALREAHSRRWQGVSQRPPPGGLPRAGATTAFLGTAPAPGLDQQARQRLPAQAADPGRPCGVAPRAPAHGGRPGHGPALGRAAARAPAAQRGRRGDWTATRFREGIPRLHK